MKRLFGPLAKNGPVALLPRPCFITSKEVNDTRGGFMLAAGRVRSKKKKNRRKKTPQNPPPNPKHTTKSTAAQRPRPTRDGARVNTSHALAYTVPLSYVSGFWGNRRRTALAFS